MAASSSFVDDDEPEQEMLDAIQKRLEGSVRPHVLRLEHADEYPLQIVEKMKTLGPFGATIRSEYGGWGLKASTYAKIVEKVASTWISLSEIFNSHLIMAACVERHGTNDQKLHYLPRFASGEIRGGLALTEPDARTDLQGIKLRARREGDHCIVSGTKTWISNGIHGVFSHCWSRPTRQPIPRKRACRALLPRRTIDVYW